VPYPDIAAREEILRVHARKIKIDPGVDLNKVARGTPGFSGADLANLINEAAIAASKKDQEAVSIADVDEARDKIILGKEMRSIVQTPKELKMTAYHEAGHALVRLLMPDDTDPIFKVTIVPRGMSLGATHYLPEREKYSATKEEMIAEIMAALGGRIAEELTFNVISTGASNDFEKATEIARKMVCHYGMSEKLGTVIYNTDARGARQYSHDTANKIDAEIRSIIDTCYEKAKLLLITHRDKLEKLALMLLEKETLQAEEVYVLLGIEPRTKHSIH
jgi:cell division protease FtsH